MEGNGVKTPNGDVVAVRAASRRQRALRRGSVLAAAIIAAVLGLAACGGGSGGSSNAGGSTNSQSLDSFSSCMRSHGVPRFPYPDSSGALPKTDPQQNGVSSSQFNAAQRACQHLLPNNGGALSVESLQQCEVAGVCSPAQMRQMMNAGLRFAQCMRSHGVPKWPDPTTSQGRVVFAYSVSRDGIDHHSPQIETKVNECYQLVPDAPLGFAQSP